MLTNDFEKAQAELRNYLGAQDPQTGRTWFEFCDERGFTMSEMTKGMEWQKRIDERRNTIEHVPAKAALSTPKR